MFYFQPDNDSFIFGPFKNKDNIKDTDLVVLRKPEYDNTYINVKISNSDLLFDVEYDRIPDNFMILPLYELHALYDKENQTLNMSLNFNDRFSNWSLPVEFIDDIDKPKCLFQLDEVIGLYLEGDISNGLDEYLYDGKQLSSYLKISEPHSIVLESKLEKIYNGRPFGEDGIFQMDTTVIDAGNLKLNLKALTETEEPS